MILVVLAIAAGCASPSPPSRPPPAEPKPAEPHTADPVPTANDPPEPTAPLAECVFARTVFCVAGTPTRTALQPSPFEWCSRTQPAREPTMVQGDAQFSAAETRAHRVALTADACCYVEFSTSACD